MKIVFYNRSLISGGIEKCIELLSQYLYKNYELEILYSERDKLDPHIVEILEKYAKVTYLSENETINCDICIFCYLYFDYAKIKKQIRANTYFCWIHSQPRALPNCVLDNSEFVKDVSKFICVSEEIKNSLNIEKEGIVIHNFININIQELAHTENPFEENEKCDLKLVVVSRLSEGKGFERLLNLVKSLEENKILYSLKIVGKGRKKEQEIKDSFKKYKNVKFEGYKDNPYCYIKNADYLVLLSDYESWGNVITEAKSLGTPCVITDFPSAKEQVVNEENGIIVPRELENYDSIVKKMMSYKELLKEKIKDFKYENEIDKWNDIIVKSK